MEKLTKTFLGLETTAIGLLALGAALLTVNEAFVRFISPASLPDWSAEVTVYLIAWAVMLGAGRMVRDNMHVRVEMVVEQMSPKGQFAAEIFTCIFGVVVTLGIVYAGIQMVNFALMLGERSDSSIRFPMWLYYVAIPFGFGLTSFQYFVRLIGLMRKGSI